MSQSRRSRIGFRGGIADESHNRSQTNGRQDRAVLGRPGRSGGGSTSDDYGSGFTPERLYGAIQAVRYDGLDLSHLYFQ
jgi:hypothetical protein